jgi:hypothetical protein
MSPRVGMFKPETSITGFGDRVLIYDPNNSVGFRVGKYTGNSRPESESYEIAVEDFYTGEVEMSFYHKEDLYENTEENVERLKGMSA